MNYYKISITAPPALQEVIIALLGEEGYDGFEQEDFSLKTYIVEGDFVEAPLKQLSEQLNFCYKLKLIPNQNWNAIWEANFKPIKIKDFCAIRADFHPSFPSVKHEIIINPKMAFGTGHHETTYLMMSLMEDLSFSDKEVLDFGCGTGILAVLADKLGAKKILAIDNDPLSFENTLENSKINNAHQIQPLLGEIDSVNGSNFDIILANINKSVILNTLNTLYKKTNTGGFNLLSGILQRDETQVKNKVKDAGFEVIETHHRGEWLCMKTYKK